jgi:1-acyl-sn-glycerol-3-phosphate acyltransferase
VSWGEDGDPVYPLARLLLAPTMMALAPGSVSYGAERVPSTGGGVLAVNHLAAIDPPLVGCLCPRPLRYMVKQELMAIPMAGEVLGWTGAFSVRRGGPDREALRTARRLAAEGQLVCVFAEGTRQRLGYPGAVRPGAAMIAIQERVPVLPAGLETFGWRLANRRRCAVVFGQPLDLTGLSGNGRGYRRASVLVAAEILRLWRQAADALAAGLPSQLADGARRRGHIAPNWHPTPRDRKRDHKRHIADRRS